MKHSDLAQGQNFYWPEGTPFSRKQCRWYILQILANLRLHREITTWLDISLRPQTFLAQNLHTLPHLRRSRNRAAIGQARPPPESLCRTDSQWRHFTAVTVTPFYLDSAGGFLNLKIRTCQQTRDKSLFPFLVVGGPRLPGVLGVGGRTHPAWPRPWGTPLFALRPQASSPGVRQSPPVSASLLFLTASAAAFNQTVHSVFNHFP